MSNTKEYRVTLELVDTEVTCITAENMKEAEELALKEAEELGFNVLGLISVVEVKSNEQI